MFLRSKFEDNDNYAINTSLINYPKISDSASTAHPYAISFGPRVHDWSYKTKEQRATEYNWVLRQLDCRVDDNVTGPTITKTT